MRKALTLLISDDKHLKLKIHCAKNKISMSKAIEDFIKTIGGKQNE